jgi:hypothetical protein
MPVFSLKKWYGDIADDQENIYIGYWVSLHWRALSLYGYQHFWHTHQTGTHTQGSFTRHPSPLWENDHLAWQTELVKGDWYSLVEPLHATLYRTERGEISWQCMQPKARASICLPGLSFSGWGYTEFIEITVPVWQLPFNTLSWGRSHTEKHYIVWIQWDGSTKQNLVWSDGKLSDNLIITDALIRGPDFQLQLGENIPLRQGQILSTIFKPYKNITRLFPKTTFLANEQKWYNLGLLHKDNTSQPATTIYERVLW